MPQRRRRRLVHLPVGDVSAGILLLALLAGCGSDEATSSSPTASVDATPTSASPGAEESSPTSASSPATDGPVTSAAAGQAEVTPATGTLMTGDSITMNSLYTSVSGGGGAVVSSRASDEAITITDFPGVISEDGSVGPLVAASRSLDIDTPKLQRVADTVIAGLPAYHRSGRTAQFNAYDDAYGFQTTGSWVEIVFSTPRSMSQAERDAQAASALATVRLR